MANALLMIVSETLRIDIIGWCVACYVVSWLWKFWDFARGNFGFEQKSNEMRRKWILRAKQAEEKSTFFKGERGEVRIPHRQWWNFFYLTETWKSLEII
jgi:hypothetical protein